MPAVPGPAPVSSGTLAAMAISAGGGAAERGGDRSGPEPEPEPEPGFWTLDSELRIWTVDSGFWILDSDSGLWILDSGLWTDDSGPGWVQVQKSHLRLFGDLLLLQTEKHKNRSR